MADLPPINGLSEYGFPDLYESIVLGTTKSPGSVKLTGHDRNKNWDIQKAKGQDGATSKLNGDDLAEFQATFTLSADGNDSDGRNDFTRWEEFQDLINSTTAVSPPVALPIYHPDLARQGITAVVNRGIGGMTHLDDGTAVVVVKFGEHRPPKEKPAAKAKSKPNPDENGYGTRVREDPNAAAKQELASLVEKAKRP